VTTSPATPSSTTSAAATPSSTTASSSAARATTHSRRWVCALVPDEHLDPGNLDVECRVDGETKQASNTEEFIFGVEDVVEYISGITTLRPGDLISTRTPGGVGIFRDPPELLEPGDTVEVEVEGIGTLTNPVVAERE